MVSQSVFKNQLRLIFSLVVAGSTVGSAGLSLVDVSLSVAETDPSVDLCVQLNLSPEITELGCPLTVTLRVIDGIFAST